MKRVYHTIAVNRRKIYEEIWEKPLIEIAKKYSLNYQELPKVLRKENIPYPAPGYWTKKKWNRISEEDIVPLPESEKENVDLPLLEYETDEICVEAKTKWSDSVLEKMDPEKRRLVLEKADSIIFDPDLKLHDVLVRYRKGIRIYRSGGNDRSYYGHYRSGNEREKPYFIDEISKQGLERAIMIMNNLFNAIEELGDHVDDELDLWIGKDRVSFSFKETTKTSKHILSEKEKKALEKYHRDIEKGKRVSEPEIRKYDYDYSGRLRFSLKYDQRIYDTGKITLEDRLGEILIMIYEQAEKQRKRREWEEAIERKRDMLEQRIKENLERKQREAERISNLRKEVSDYQTACSIREYIEFIKKKKGDLVDPEWLKWANLTADWYDPSVNAENPVLGIRKREFSCNLDDLSKYLKQDNNCILDEDELYLPWIDF